MTHYSKSIALIVLVYSCAQALSVSPSLAAEPLPGYPTEPQAATLSESFAGRQVSSARWEVKDGWQLWDSWLDRKRIRIRGGKLLLTTDARYRHNGLLKVGGLVSRKFFSYGRFTIRAQANGARGVVTCTEVACKTYTRRRA